jgi:hypothetical protein
MFPMLSGCAPPRLSHLVTSHSITSCLLGSMTRGWARGEAFPLDAGSTLLKNGG